MTIFSYYVGVSVRKEGRRWVEREGDGWRGKVMGGEGRGWVEREGKRKRLRRVAIGGQSN